MLRRKTNLSKLKRIEITQSVFSDHNGMKLEINNRKKFRKLINMWKLNNTLLSNQVVKGTKRELLNPLGVMKTEIKTPELTGAAKVLLREKFIAAKSLY